MSDSENNHLPDEEYRLPDDEEYVAPEPESTTESTFQGDNESATSASPIGLFFKKTKNYLPKSRNGRIGLVLVVILAFFVIFKLLSSDNKKIIQPAPQAKPQPVAQSPVVQAPTVVQPQTSVDQSDSSIDALQTDSSQISTEVSGLKTKMEDANSSIAQLTASNQQLENALAALTNQVSLLTKKLNQTMARISSGAMGGKLVYHLRAVLPDRAWIVSNRGQLLTVTLGNKIDQYGVVKSIDAEQGILFTSSGRNIYYGSNDF